MDIGFIRKGMIDRIRKEREDAIKLTKKMKVLITTTRFNLNNN